MSRPEYELLEHALAEWAAARADVLGIVIIGSRARAEKPPDHWSDLDAIIFVAAWQVYTHAGAWREALYAAFARPVWFGAYEPVDVELPEYEFVLEGGLKVDLVFTSPAASQSTLAEMVAGSSLRFVFERGARVLIDKTPGKQPLPALAPEPLRPPAEGEFTNRVACYLNELVRASNLLGHGELWRAAKAINEELRPNLLALLEWQARARAVPGSIRWSYGRFLEEWADPRALAALPATYTDSTPAGTRAAIRACLELLAWLGPGTARLLGIGYPEQMVRSTSAWLAGEEAGQRTDSSSR